MTSPRLRSALLTLSLATGLHHRTETLIKAPPGTVWRLHTDVARWPAWQPAVTSAQRLDPGPLRPADLETTAEAR